MAMAPDTKDWTWVLERACPDCGFDASTLDATSVAPLMVNVADAWREVLDGDRSELATRPDDDTWSPLEYACHVRDVFRMADVRFSLMLDQDDPQFQNWDQDETAVSDRYNEQDPAQVAADTTAAAAVAAGCLHGLVSAGWDRPGTRSDGARFTVASFARYVIHDPMHHLHDVGRADLIARVASNGV